MMRVRRFQHTPKAKCTKCLWFVTCTEYLTEQEYEAQRTNLSYRKDLGKKSNCLCKFHYRFPNCPVRTKSLILSDVSKNTEQAGEDNHSLETFSYGLPQ